MPGLLGPQANLQDADATNFYQGPQLSPSSVLHNHSYKDTNIKEPMTHFVSGKSVEQDSPTSLSEYTNPGRVNCLVNNLSFFEVGLDLVEVQIANEETGTNLSLVSGVGSDVSVESTSNQSAPEILAENITTVDSHEPIHFALYFNERFCKVSKLDDCRDLPDIATHVEGTSSHCEREKLEGDGDRDDMMGGIFTFCEEGNGEHSFLIISIGSCMHNL